MSSVKLDQQKQVQNNNEELMSYSSALEHIKKIKPEAYVLLTSRVKNLYLQALTQENWKKEVCAQYGEAVWQTLEMQRVSNSLSAVTHQHQTVSVDCEKLQLSHQALTADQIVKASQTMDQIASGIQTVLSAIIAEATDLLTSDEALYKAYQAFDYWPDSMSEVDLEETLPIWKTEVLEKVDWISRLLDRFSNSYHLFRIDFIRLIQLISTPYTVEKLKQKYPKRSFTVNYFQETFNLVSQSQELPDEFDIRCQQWENLLKERITDLEQKIQSEWDSETCSILIQNLNNQSTLHLVYNETEQAQSLLAKSLKLSRELVDKEDTDESKKRLAQTLMILVDLATANKQKEHKEQTLLYARECLALNQSLTKSLKKQKMQKKMSKNNFALWQTLGV